MHAMHNSSSKVIIALFEVFYSKELTQKYEKLTFIPTF
jgi:hypothetical protein